MAPMPDNHPRENLRKEAPVASQNAKDSLLNISCYAFTPIPKTKLPALKQKLLKRALQLEIKGSILLATEGINMFLSGPEKKVLSMVASVNQQGFDLIPKKSYSPKNAFNRMFVKIKKEIISMGCPEVQPSDKQKKPAPYIQAETLKAWLDEGKDLCLLDTRNGYEIDLGAFKDALTLPIDTFRAFPQAIKSSDTLKNLKNKTIVTYCTGGIRCEKAAMLMQDEGFSDVYQLDGGILKYFEICGGDHYEGECFVFDQRVAVDSNIQATSTIQCFACRHPITIEEQQLMQDNICPYCQKNILT